MLEMGLAESLCDPPVQTFDSGQGGSKSRLSTLCWRGARPNLFVIPLFRPRTLGREGPLPYLTFSGPNLRQLSSLDSQFQTKGILTLLRKLSLIVSAVLNGIPTKLSILTIDYPWDLG